jgi:phosphoglycolate phosphatase-like HAD superfamily hydrolase
MSKSIKVIVFDFDGVLVDSVAVKRGAYFDVFAGVSNAQVVVERALRENSDGDRYQIINNILRRLAAGGILSPSDDIATLCEFYAEKYNCICEEHAASCSEMIDVSKNLSVLAERYALYINSATQEEPLKRIMAKRGWQRHFREVFGRPGTKVENLEKIMKREKIDPDEVVFVGDEQRDMDAALQCRCHFAGIQTNSSPFDPQPLHAINGISELEDLLSSLSSTTR